MQLTLKKVPTDKCYMPYQPRSNPDPAYCRSLGESMKEIGQQVPIIGYTEPSLGRFAVTDGGCRVVGGGMVGIAELLALDLGKEPTRVELLMAQAAIDYHKQHLKTMDRARLWQSNIKERGCTARQLAKELGVSDSLVGDYLSLLTLPPDVQEQLNSGKLHMSKGCVIAQMESDADRQRELAALAPDLSRKALAAKVGKKAAGNGQAATVTTMRVRIAMPGAMIVLTGKELGMAEVVELLSQTLKEARKAAEQYDVKTFQSMMKDKAKAGGKHD
jgi:ParB family chromosome partitioning protein